jgi:MinD-like ATPase involved in chromosome partitioning or flagellar assembly
MTKEGMIVTFYSYKGGVGRTFTMANVAALLSKWGYKTLCIDWDLEAPGLHLYFQPWIKQETQSGLTELIQDYVDEKKPRSYNLKACRLGRYTFHKIAGTTK